MVDRLLEPESLQSRRILRTRVDATSYRHTCDQVLDWAAAGESRYVCVATVNNLIEGVDDPGYNALMDDVLDDLAAALTTRHEGLRIAYRWSPLFRALTAEEEARVTDELVRSGTRVLFVGLDTPKQRWMADHKGLPLVMLGVGAAFDFLSGRKRQAPPALQRLGLEWLHRLVREPRRLWKRYLYRNPRVRGPVRRPTATPTPTEEHTMTQRTALVTGAGGFIGHHLVKYLQGLGDQVRGTDIKASKYEETTAEEFEPVDLREWENCLKVTSDVDEVYQLAADMGGIGYITAFHADIARNNVLINAHMLQAAAENKVARYFYASSACIYPMYRQESPDVTPLKEEDAYPADPEEGYGWEKLYAEKLCQYYTEEGRLDTRVARFHNIYGPIGTYDGGREKAPAAICRRVALAGDGDQLVEVAKAAGVTCSLTTEIELADPRSSEFGWGRLEVGEDDTGAAVEAKLHGHYAWMGAAREGFRAVFRC